MSIIILAILGVVFTTAFVIGLFRDWDWEVEAALALIAVFSLVFLPILAFDAETRVSVLPTSSVSDVVGTVDELSSSGGRYGGSYAVTLTTESGKRLSAYLSLEQYGALREGDEVNIKVIQKNGPKYSYTLYYLELATSERCCEQIDKTPKPKK